MASFHIPVPRPLVCTDNKEENLARFTAAFTDYAIATKLDDEPVPRQIATLRAILGDECRELLLNSPLLQTDEASTATYLQALTSRFAPPTNYLFARYAFETATQQGNEQIDQFHTRLRGLAKPCKFTDITERIRDRLVFGTLDKPARAVLFKLTDIALDKVVEHLRISESTNSQLRRVEGHENPELVHAVRTVPGYDGETLLPDPDDLLKLHTYRNRTQPSFGRSPHLNRNTSTLGNQSTPPSYQPGRVSHHHSSKSCLYCGGTHVLKKTACPAYGKSCLGCGTPNHFQKMCRKSRQFNPNAHVRQLEELHLTDAPSPHLTQRSHITHHPPYHTLSTSLNRSAPVHDFECYDDFFIVEDVALLHSSPSNHAKLFCDIQITDDGSPLGTLTCQLDTGATCNVLSCQDLCNLKHTQHPKLLPSTTQLRLYDGSLVSPLGEYVLHCSVEGRTMPLTFKIVQGSNPPLISAQACQALHLIKVHPVCQQYSSRPRSHTVHSTISDPPPCLIRQLQGLPTMVPPPPSTLRIVAQFPDVFTGLGRLPGRYHIVVNKDVLPVQHAPRRVPVALLEPLQDKLRELEEQAIIERVTTPTPWISSLVLVHQKNKIRFCLDPKDLNKAIQRPRYQMPTLQDILPRLKGAKIFSVLDAKDGFHQVALSDASAKLTTFWTPFGRFCYKRLPFGICSAPEEFQRRLLEILDGLPGVLDIADDILVVGCGNTMESALVDHDNNLQALLLRARQQNLKFNRAKLRLALPEVAYMGHIITSQGIKPDPNKVKAIVDLPAPSDKKGLQRFLGCITYLSQFIPNLSQISEPLRMLLVRDNAFMWQSSQETVFQRLKLLITSAPVLAFYDPSQPITIQCDASESGLGAVLLQNGLPVTYASRSLTTTERNYAQIEKECLAILFSCVRFHHYIGARPDITVETDHKPLLPIFLKPIRCAPKRLQRMLLQLPMQSLQLVYRPGSAMYIADMLSRAALPGDGTTLAPHLDIFYKEELLFEATASVDPTRYLAINSDTLQLILGATTEDPVSQSLIQTILQGFPATKTALPPHLREYWSTCDELTSQGGFIYKGNRILIPPAIRSEILKRLHFSHVGADATIRKAKDLVFWPGIHNDIREYVSRCNTCNAFLQRHCKEPLRPLDIPLRPWQMIGQDVFTLHNIDYLITVDYFSHFYELDILHNTTSKSIINATKQHFARHGVPQILVTDNGPNLVSQEYSAFASAWGFVHITTSPYHSQANGKAESTVKVAKRMVKKAIYSQQDIYLALLEWRNVPQPDGTSPAQKLLSRRTRGLLPMTAAALTPEVVENIPEEIANRQHIVKRSYDQGTRELPDILPGKRVTIDPLKRHTPWVPGTCISTVGPRSYLIHTDCGSTLRRNRKFIHILPDELPQTDKIAAIPEVSLPKECVPTHDTDHPPSMTFPLVPRPSQATKLIPPPPPFPNAGGRALPVEPTLSTPPRQPAPTIPLYDPPTSTPQDVRIRIPNQQGQTSQPTQSSHTPPLRPPQLRAHTRVFTRSNRAVKPPRHLQDYKLN